MTEKIKGAFKDFPVAQQPIRIPINIYDDLARFVLSRIEGISECFVPSCEKSAGKPDTGDLDVFINPKNRNTWRVDFEKIFKDHIIAKISNGPQLMVVMKDTIDDKKYMIDFILAKEGSFDYRKKYSKFGTIIPAVVGSYARSLLYKFDQNELSLRLISKKGNFHNIPLTNDFDTALKILMLDPKPYYEDKLFLAQEVAHWIAASPRFDSALWNKPLNTNGQSITVKNKKSHRAIKIKPNVQTAYDILDKVEKKASWDNSNYKIERQLFGDEFVDRIIEEANKIEEKEDKILSGHEIMEILKINEGGFIVGKILKHIRENNLTREQAISYVLELKI